jgi:heme/copper-type cytochrome/quinol oxidase subunit 2
MKDGQCNGPCDQGRKNCPTPEACELAAADAAESDGLGAVGMLVVSIVVVLVIGLVAASIWRFA